MNQAVVLCFPFIILMFKIFKILSAFRESEGSFQYGNYNREAEDLRDVVKHFLAEKRFIMAVVGHSKGKLPPTN